MTDGDPSSSVPRRRPSFGLPGPGNQQGQGGPAPQGNPEQPAAHSGLEGAGTPSWNPAPAGQGTGGPGAPYGAGHEQGSAPASAWTGAGAPTGLPPAPRRKRRGVVPLVIGLVMLIVVAPIVVIGGIVWGISSLFGDTMTGPTAFGGAETSVEVPANAMIIVYVPSADTEASCTAEGDVSTVPTSGSVTFPDGTSYEQALGVVATADTTVTVSCTGTEGAGYLGPYNLLGMAGPLVIGPILGVVIGLIGLVLTIIGIVMLVRSRRP